MCKPKNLSEVLIAEIKDLYSAEIQLIEALPKMAEAADDPILKKGFREHGEQTRGQARRLEQAAEILGAIPGGETCQAMQGLLAECSERITLPAGSVRNSSLICAAQRVEHYEIAGYTSVRNFAFLLGHEDVAKLFKATLGEELAADKKLAGLAAHINPEAELAAVA
jgi:ferritin-like metal-binding protein YciE